MRIRIGRRMALAGAAVLALAAAGFGAWDWLRPRSIDVCVISDYSFRQQRADWYQVLSQRFGEVNRLFSGTGVKWRFFHANQPDPTRNLHQMETRRQKLMRAECRADVIVAVTGFPEAAAAGDVAPFSHTAIVVDDPRRPEAHNVRVFAHGLAALFGVPVDPAGAGTLMTEPPESGKLPAAASRLIRRLRDYDFRAGAAALRGAWGDRAVAALTDAFAGRPGSAAAHAQHVLGIALAADEAYQPAIGHLREAARLEASNPVAHVDLANVLQHDFDYPEAVAEYRQALGLTPGNAAIHAALALALANSGLAQEAGDELAAALRLNPRFVVAQAALGHVLAQQLGRANEAIAAYQAALQMDPEMEQAREGLAEVEAVKRTAAEDAAARRALVARRPGDALAHLDLAVSEARAGTLDAALAEFRRSIELDPSVGRAHADLALLLYLRKDYAAGWREAQAAQKNGFPPPADLVRLLQRKASE